jgi:hypothetical protein
VLAVAPNASGTPVWLIEAEHTVVWAFIEAGALAVLAIAVMLWITLRHLGDVLLTLVPLIVAGAVTLEVMVPTGESLNFANVIALRAAARRRGGVQDLLYHGLARRPNQPAAVNTDARRVFQRADDGDGVRQPLALRPAWHVEHGQADGSGTGLHIGRRGSVPASPDGAAAQRQRPECGVKVRVRGPCPEVGGAAQHGFGTPGSILERLQLRLPNRSARSRFVSASLSAVY